MKKLMSLLVVMSLASAVWATPYEFNGALVEVDAWLGEGANETILVIDWNRLDHGASTVSESHAFGYRWEGQKTELEMLQDFDAAGIFSIVMETAPIGSYLGNIIFNDGTEVHSHIESGSWNSGCTTNPYARWGTWGDTEWDFDMIGMSEKNLIDGRFEGINAVMYYGTIPEGCDAEFQLNIPLLPEPATLILLVCGLMGLGKRYSRAA